VTSRLTPAELDSFGRLLRKLLPEADAVPVGGCAPAHDEDHVAAG
jgi:hypothetical protein